MSVLIKGMEMPKNGETITITICDDGIVFEDWKEPGSVFKAIPVPPHSRLIDADALMENAQYKGKHDIVTAYDIVAAPTIIESEDET